MAYQPTTSKILYTTETASLADGASLTTGYIDFETYDKYQVSVLADSAGLDLVQDSRLSDSGAVLSTTVEITIPFSLSNFTARQRFINHTLENNTGSAVTNVRLEIKGTIGSSDKASVFPLELSPLGFSPAMLTQSVLIGQDNGGTYRNAKIDQFGALIEGDFGIEAARGFFDGIEYSTKFGRNPDIDIGTAPEDMWNGGSVYTGFNATQNRNLEVFSSDANDAGSLVSSGTATGGTGTTIVDSGANFTGDGVVVGDIVLNDTKGLHGFVNTVSATELTIDRWYDGVENGHVADSGDTYRVATSSSTGAAVVRWENPLDEDHVEQTPAYTILNGVSTVVTTGNFFRLSTGRVVMAGSTGRNEGTITARQQTDTANVFVQMPTFGRTTIGCWTVPFDKVCVIKNIKASIVRGNGSPGSATIVLYTREFRGAFNGSRVYEVGTDSAAADYIEGGLVLPPRTDIKFTIDQVSDNDTIAQASADFYFIDEQA